MFAQSISSQMSSITYNSKTEKQIPPSQVNNQKFDRRAFVQTHNVVIPTGRGLLADRGQLGLEGGGDEWVQKKLLALGLR